MHFGRAAAEESGHIPGARYFNDGSSTYQRQRVVSILVM